MDELVVETPEGVPLHYRLAGAGSRFTAALLDLAFFGTVAFGVGLAFAVLAQFDPTGLSDFAWGALAGGWLLLFALTQIVFGVLWRGQTLGKRILGLRVTGLDGYPASFLQHVMRSTFVMVDMIPPVPLPVGLVLILGTAKRQRLGDFVAGTVVLYERREPQRAVEPGVSWSGLPRRDVPLVPALAQRLSAEDVRLIEDLLGRTGMHPEARRHLFVDVGRHYAQRLGLEGFADARTFLKELLLFMRELRRES